MDTLKRFLKDLLMHPAIVVAACVGVEEFLPQVLTSLDMLPAEYRRPVSLGVAGVLLALRGLKGVAVLLQAQQTKQAALQAAQAAEQKRQEEIVP